MIAEIARDFAQVTRQDGVSWSEALVIDNYGSEEECAAARASDKDKHWAELVDDEAWDADQGYGGFSFLDAIGFRYYLPAAMTRCIRTGEDGTIRIHLSRAHDGISDWRYSTLGLLDGNQRRCVARFLALMVDISRQEHDVPLFAQWWQETLDNYWHQFL